MMFTGTARFTLIDKLGEGGMGIVYEAYDHSREMRVALKTLRHVDAAGLYRFKREFRALSDLSHPNIVALYELFAEEEHWFLTMELVEGQDFISFVRGSRQLRTSLELLDDAETQTSMRLAAQPRPAAVSLADLDLGIVEPVLLGLPSVPELRPHVDELVDLDRLRIALGQLARALHALHSAGMVHRDIKPSNVRVTAEERVVLMDFGIVAETREPDNVTLGDLAVGTPWFMAPEQLGGGTATAAADWYAFGVLMYLALTGHLPYEGPADVVMTAKHERDALPPSRFAEGIPEDLESLCISLLSRLPTRRPSSSAVLEQLGVASRNNTEAGSQGSGEPSGSRDSGLFVGRASELERLRDTYGAMLAGTTSCVLVRGMSGMGKTSLIERFFDELRAAGPELGDPFLLAGRCHERESLSYKAFDGVIDSLSYHLMAMPQAERSSVLPEDITLLARLFPVLRRVLGASTVTPLEGANPLELRTQAVAALRVLLTRLAQRHPIVIRVEDIQWADPDSLDLLLSLLEPPVPRGILILATVRAEVLESGDNMPLVHAIATLEQRGVCRHVVLGPLPEGERRELVRRLLHDDTRLEPISEQLWNESGGHPMLLAELARYAREEPAGLEPTGRLHLEDVIWRRVTRLPAPARALIEVIAMAGQPTSLKVLATAAGLSEVERERASTILCVGHLARVARSRAEPWLDAFHDKVREAISEHVLPERARALHAQLARALEAAGNASSATIARHYVAAGEIVQAASYLLEAAQLAAEQLAFDRAATLYRRLLALVPTETGDSTLDRTRCRAWIGLAQGMRIVDGRAGEALALLGDAEPVATAHGFAEELAEIHYLRGNLLFPRGDLDGCMREHEQSWRYARMAGSAEAEARALSGLGDALYMGGRMLSAFNRFDGCIDLCRRHGLTSIAAANLSMRGLTRYYQNQLEDALRDGEEAASTAARLTQRRAELVARSSCVGLMLLELDRLDEAQREYERALDLVGALGARRFEPFSLSGLAKILALRGRRTDAAAMAECSVAACKGSNNAFLGPLALGVLAYVAIDDRVYQRALAEAEELLQGHSVGHNYLHFYRDAIDAALSRGDAAAAQRYAGLLDAYTRPEPLPWSDFFRDRGLVLARHLRGERGPEIEAELRRLLKLARDAGYVVAARALEMAAMF